MSDPADGPPDLWRTRALPLLRAIASAEEDPAVVQAQGPRPEELADALGLDLDTTRRTLRDLSDDEMVTGVRADNNDTVGWYAFALRLTPKGRRTIGQWPSGERALDDLIDLLAAMAEAEEDPDRRSRLQRAGLAVAGLGRDLGVNVAAAFLARITGAG